MRTPTSEACTCGSQTLGSHEIDCPAYTRPWVPIVGDRVRIIESGHDAIVARVRPDGRGWYTMGLLVEPDSRHVTARPADVILIEEADTDA